MSKNVDISVNLNYDGNGNEHSHYRGFKIMTDNQTELIRLILENDNIEQAIMTASAIIHDLLMQHESSEEQLSARLQASDQARASY